MLSSSEPNKSCIRNSAIVDKPRDAFVHMQWRGWTPKNTHQIRCGNTYGDTYYHTEFGCSALRNVGINTREPTKLRSAGIPLSWDGRRGWPKIHALPHMCYNFKFCSSVTKGVGINRKEPQKFRSAGTSSLGVGCGWLPKNKSSPHMCYHIKFCSSATKGVRINRKQHPKLGIAGSPPPWAGAWLTTQKQAPYVLRRPICWFCVKGYMHK